MNAVELIRRRVILAENAFAEIVIWQVPQPVVGCSHCFKYRLVFVVNGECVVRYDNEAGKGDHRHMGESELPYLFLSPHRLMTDFMNDIRRWQDEHRNA